MRLPPARKLYLHAADLQEQLAGLPSTCGIYALHAAGKAAHISWSVNLRRRLSRLLVSSYTSGSRDSVRERLRSQIESVEYWPTGSKLETSLLLYQLTKEQFPEDYLFRLRLRMPWFVTVHQGDAFPRLAVVNRISRKCSSPYGPFPSRDVAQRYEEEVLALFQLRRCTEMFTPAPDHPGCIYGEMNQCLRPCQCAVTADEYGSEVARVADFLATNGKSSIAVLQTARERAAAQTDFEEAAQIHKRIQKVNAAAALRDEIVRAVDSFSGLALTRGSEPGEMCFWPMVNGFWQEPLRLQLSLEEPSARSLDQQLRELFASGLAAPDSSGKRLEHLAIFSRWFYSSWRDGEWFPFRTPADLNYRRLVKEISKHFRAANAGGEAILTS